MDRFKMEVTNIIDHEDGSATVTFDLSNECIMFLAKVGLIKILTDAAKEHENGN